MPASRALAVLFVLPLLFAGLFLPFSLFAAEDTCSAESKAAKGTVTNDCVVCITDSNGNKRDVGAKCTLSGGGSTTAASCTENMLLPAGSCEVTYKTLDGKTAKAVQTTV